MDFRPLLIAPPIVLGVLGFMWMTQPENTVSTPQEEARLAVRFMTVVEAPLTLTATGYGRVQALQSWNAVSQVEGRVQEVFANLAVGTVVEAGDLLIQIDPTDYELKIAKTEANIAAAQATLTELLQKEENTGRLLEVEQRVFEVAQTEFDRIKALSQNGTVTTASFDNAQKALLNQENAVINLTNTLALYPTQLATAKATLSVREAELAEARRGRANTSITAPFRGRVSTQSIETGQFVRVGNDLLTLDAIDQAEVIGAFQPSVFSNLMRTAVGPQLQNIAEIDATRMIEYMERAGVLAYVERDFAGTLARYSAVPTRFRGAVDSETGTFGIVVRLDNPLVGNAQSGTPPLEFGSFVSVTVEATPDARMISIPRAILQHDDNGQPFVYTVNAEDRLALTPVTPGPVVGDRILISAGLTEGDRVLLSTPRPSVPGVALEPISVDRPNQ
jgi:multidrug resistance efflux pump